MYLKPMGIGDTYPPNVLKMIPTTAAVNGESESGTCDTVTQ
jgi:hypothetical protein